MFKPGQLTATFNRADVDPTPKPKATLEAEILKLNKLLSSNALTYEFAPSGNIRTIDRDRDRVIRHKIRGLEARIKMRGKAAKDFKRSHQQGVTKAKFNKHARGR